MTTIACDVTPHSRPSSGPRTTALLAENVGACIRRYRAGDREAMADLTRQVTPWLRNIARGYRLPRDTVDDIVQSTLLVALLHIHALRDPASGLSWLSVIARREALRVIRTERRCVPVDDPASLHLVADPGDGPEEVLLADLDRAAVRRNVAKLPQRQRLLLERVSRSDQPNYSSISRELSMPPGSIGPTRRRGLEKVRRLLAADPQWVLDASA